MTKHRVWILLPILAIGMVFRGMSAPLLFLCSIHAYGRPQIVTSAVQLAALAIALPVGLRLGGLEGATWGVVATSALGLAVLAAQCAALRVHVPPGAAEPAGRRPADSETGRSAGSRPIAGSVGSPAVEEVNA